MRGPYANRGANGACGPGKPGGPGVMTHAELTALPASPFFVA